MSEASRRVRVTGGPSPRPTARSGIPIDEADAVFARALRRAQLRLALGVVAGFVVVMAALALGLALVPELDTATFGGIPLSWLLHAFAFYPVIVVFALIYQRGAARNERRYRQLKGSE